MAQNSVTRTHTEGSVLQQMFGWVVPAQAVQHPVHMVVNTEQHVPSSSGSAYAAYRNNYDTHYKPGQPETAAIRRTDYETPDSNIPEAVRARPWLKSANGIGGRTVNTVAQDSVGGFGARGDGYYQRAYGAYDVPTDYIPTSTFDRSAPAPVSRSVLFSLNADQVQTGNRRLLAPHAAQPSQFDLDTFHSHPPPGAQYVDSSSGRRDNDPKLDAPSVLGQHRTSGPDPGYMTMNVNSSAATDGVAVRGLQAVGSGEDAAGMNYCALV